VIDKPRIERVREGGGVFDAIRDDKALPQTSTYLEAHSRARTWHLAKLPLRHGFGGLLIERLSIGTDL
jgi:hypothetical protein